MSLAEIANTTLGAVSRAVSSRRSFFGGAAAVVLGGGITAGVAANVADYAEAAECSKFRTSEAAYNMISDANPDATDEACAALANPIADNWDCMLRRMGTLHAATSEGLAARALALTQYSTVKPGASRYPFAFQPDQADDVTSLLLHILLTDAVRMIGGLSPAPDAEFLALRPEFDRLHALMIDYNKNLIPDGETKCVDFDALCDRIVPANPAAPAEGHAFQAAAAMHHLTYRLTDCEEGSSPVWLLLKGLPGNACQSVEAWT